MLAWMALFAAISAAGTWLARRYALKRHLLDEPGERRSHSVATPRGGGAGIVLALLVAALTLGNRFPAHQLFLAAFSIGLLMVAVAGWMDDHAPLSPWWRLLTHCVAGALLGAAIWEASDDPVRGVLAAAAVVVLVNIWNFMDGIDGMAASQAAIVAASIALLSAAPESALGWAMVAACIGFLPFNFPAARIFLGDVGSGSLGFAIAAAWFAVTSPGSGGVPLGALVLLPLAPFLVDAGLTLLRRVVRRERWWTAHDQHAYQAWARRRGHAPVTCSYAAATAAGLVLAIELRGMNGLSMAALVAAWYTSAALAWLWLQYAGATGSRSDRSMKGEG